MIKVRLQNFAFGIFVSVSSILILLYGVIGTKGHPFITAALLVSPLIVLMGRFKLIFADFLFAAFLATAAFSLLINGKTTTYSEYAQFAITLAAYPALRGFSRKFDPSWFICITAPIVVIGTILTAWAIVYDRSGEIKPLIFGFREGPTVFTMSLCFLIFAVASLYLPWQKLIIPGALIAAPLSVFAAAMVRHPFVSLCLTLAILAVFEGRWRYSAAITGAICLVLLVGLASRPTMSVKLIELVAHDTFNPVKCNSEDTAAIRGILAKEAVSMIPASGPFGMGIGSFAKRSCYKATPHNIVLQAAVELGIPAALILIALFMSAAMSVAGSVRFDPIARFAFCGLTFTGLEFLMSGSLTNGALFFGFIGWSVGLRKAPK